MNHRNAVLEGLRGIAAVAVTTHHFTMRTDDFVLFSSAQMAVDMFFCISGLVIAMAYGEKIRQGMAITTFFWRRVQRLYPLFFLGMCLGLGGLTLKYLHGLTDYQPENIAKAALLNFFYLPYFANFTVEIFQDSVTGVVFPLNGPAWSLFFGFAAQFVYFYAVRGGRIASLVIAAISGIGFIIAAKIDGQGGWGSHNFIAGFPRVFYAFFIGVVIYEWRDRLPKVSGRFVPLLFLLIALMMLPPEFPKHKYYWFASASIIVPLIVATALACQSWSYSWGQRLATYGGSLSYPLYCLHVPTLAITSTFIAHHPYQRLGVYASILLCFVLAHLAAKYIDQPLVTYFSNRRNARA
jgi:peptidoglycan/LPS O-acetylase OafA/YrhL